MNSEFYKEAKLAFQELVDLDEVSRQQRLEEIAAQSSQLADEVRSLLEYHTAQSIIVQTGGLKLKTRATLSTTGGGTSLSWFSEVGKMVAIIVPTLVVLIAIAGLSNQAIWQAARANAIQRLQAKLTLQADSFESWRKYELEKARMWAHHPTIKTQVDELLELARELPNESKAAGVLLADAPFGERLGGELQRLIGRQTDFTIWDWRRVTLADSRQNRKPNTLGQVVTPAGAAMLDSVLKGQAKMVLAGLSNLEAKEGEDAVVVGVIIPIKDDAGTVVAALLLQGYGLAEELKAQIQGWVTSAGSSTFMVNADGAALTPLNAPPNVNEMKLAYQSVNNDLVNQLDQAPANKPGLVLLRDPGKNLVQGQTPTDSSATWPMTVAARQVTSKEAGISETSYRNCFGEPVIGAWKWLSDAGLGIVVEERLEDAYANAYLVQRVLIGTTLIAAISLIILMLVVTFTSPTKRKLRDLSEVGPYQVSEVLGEGGMGCVYLAEHALLCRQSAVKVLTNPDMDLSVLGRFEREVQLASQLTHPNTISIYDFGRNDNGVFYYAMEYIEGAHLGQLVEFGGPIEPGRCIYILRQLCRALHEAHLAGVVHRDIKPQNIMVCSRGGEPDFVKLFDYGLVKAFAPGVSQTSSQTRVVVGTPRFMAPERLNSPWLADPRVDVYSVGALAYYLLTGKLPPLVTIEPSVQEQPGVETLDLPPDVVAFGGLLSSCMGVETASRPSGMQSLLRELEALANQFPWSRTESLAWWKENESKLLLFVKNKRKKLNRLG